MQISISQSESAHEKVKRVLEEFLVQCSEYLINATPPPPAYLNRCFTLDRSSLLLRDVMNVGPLSLMTCLPA
jgi:hypothetical protein